MWSAYIWTSWALHHGRWFFPKKQQSSNVSVKWKHASNPKLWFPFPFCHHANTDPVKATAPHRPRHSAKQLALTQSSTSSPENNTPCEQKCYGKEWAVQIMTSSVTKESDLRNTLEEAHRYTWNTPVLLCFTNLPVKGIIKISQEAWFTSGFPDCDQLVISNWVTIRSVKPHKLARM